MSGLLHALQPVVAPVECSGQRHRIRWATGDLTALDHDDPDGERALVAMGGPSCACLDVLDAWGRECESTRLLTALSRGTRDPVRPQEFGGIPGFLGQRGATAGLVVNPGPRRLPPRSSNAMTISGRLAPRGFAPSPMIPQPGREGPFGADLVVLANLGYPMTLRLVATVTSALLEKPGDAAHLAVRPALTASLFGRSLTALRDWLGIPHLEIELTIADAGGEPVVELVESGPMRVVLPLEWVVSVWGRDLTIVAGRFCLGVIESTASRMTLLSVGPDFEGPRRLAIEFQ